MARFICDGVFFDHQPTFIPADALRRTAAEEWTSLQVVHDPEKRPIILWRSAGGNLLAEDIAEATQALSSSADSVALPGLADSLSETSVIYAFEVNESSLTDDAWNMLDALEAHLARTCDGIVYSPGDGFLDADLKLVAALS